MSLNYIKKFFHLESASGIILFSMAALALIISNSPWQASYLDLLQLKLAFHLGAFNISKPLLLWINDGLMAIFFLVVGLELKREILEGQLSSISQLMLPGTAAIGGIIIPALIYLFFNHGHADTINGWAIPVATDIAFALGILSLFGKRIPTSLKLFLMTLAIIDDLGAIIIIALFHSKELSLLSLVIAIFIVAILIIMNRLGVKKLSPYMILGTLLWFCVLKSGVHATLAGVVLAFTIPLRGSEDSNIKPLHILEEKLHTWVAFFIMPIFAFANSGISFGSVNSLNMPLFMGIVMGLFVGKQIGVYGFTTILIKLKLVKRPNGISWLALYGVSLLCGVGFTMSLFIGSLAFTNPALLTQVRIAVMLASILSGLLGAGVLYYATKQPKTN